MIITGVLGFIAAVLVIPGGWLYTKGENEVKEAAELETEAQLCLADLNHVASNQKQTETMDVNTFDGIPIVKSPPNYKNYIGYLTKKPEHGTVLLGPGIQFLYGPQEGYTGSDTFLIEYIDNGELKTLEIHITIQEIPTLTTPSGG